MYGRVNSSWALANKNLMKRDGRNIPDEEQFTKMVIEGLWQFCISVWTQRNANEQGKSYGVSLIERERVFGQIEQIYENLRVVVEDKDLWLFQKSLEERLSDKYDSQVAWLQVLRELYAYHEYLWYDDDRRSVRHVEYIKENLHGRRLHLW